MKLSLPAAALLWFLPSLGTAQVAILHIQVIEGEGAVNVPGARSTRPLAVEITDETGKPVAGAAVSFHLPDDGPGGTFGNGLRTDVLITDVRGRATLRNLQLNHTPGRFSIRIVVSKEQARAGMVTFQYIAEPTSGSLSSPAPQSKPRLSRGAFKWLAIALLAGGAAAVGAVAAGRTGSPGSTATSLPTATPPSIGTPSITVGKP